MTPDDLELRLPEYADGELPAELRAQIERELPLRPAWREQVQRWQALRQRLRAAIERTPVPAGLAERVRRSLRRDALRAPVDARRLSADLPQRPPPPFWDASSGHAAPPPS